MLNTAADYAFALAREFTPQERLNMAILMRNALVEEGAAKSLIRYWNAEISDLLWLLRRMP
jgi:hypothetical protein